MSTAGRFLEGSGPAATAESHASQNIECLRRIPIEPPLSGSANRVTTSAAGRELSDAENLTTLVPSSMVWNRSCLSPIGRGEAGLTRLVQLVGVSDATPVKSVPSREPRRARTPSIPSVPWMSTRLQAAPPQASTYRSPGTRSTLPPPPTPVRNGKDGHADEVGIFVLGHDEHRPGLFNERLKAGCRWVGHRLIGLTLLAVEDGPEAVHHEGSRPDDRHEENNGKPPSPGCLNWRFTARYPRNHRIQAGGFSAEEPASTSVGPVEGVRVWSSPFTVESGRDRVVRSGRQPRPEPRRRPIFRSRPCFESPPPISGEAVPRAARSSIHSEGGRRRGRVDP